MIGVGRQGRFQSVIEVEALVAQQGVLLAEEQRWKNVIVETDSKILFEALTKAEKNGPWQIQQIVKETKQKKLSFDSFKVSFIKRETNRFVDFIAQSFKLGMLPLNWVVCPPSSLSVLLFQDEQYANTTVSNDTDVIIDNG